jgi:hypothetical protein
VLSRARLAAHLALVVTLAACGPSTSSHRTAGTAAVPARGVGETPAAAAGGACQLLDFYAVEQLLAVRFAVAAAAQREATSTCVLQHSATSYPDLTLAVSGTSGTGVNAATFRAMAPPGATDVPGVGQVAYQVVRPAAGTAGDAAAPGTAVELSWLTRTALLMMVRYRFPATATDADVAAIVPRMVDLAKFLDPA